MTAIIDGTACEVETLMPEPSAPPDEPARTPMTIYPHQRAIVLLWSDDGATVTTYRMGGVDHLTAHRQLVKAADVIGDDYDQLVAAAKRERPA